MASDQESHHLVDEFLVCEATGLKCHRDDVDAGRLLFFHILTLASNKISACLLDEAVRFDDFLVPLVTVKCQVSNLTLWYFRGSLCVVYRMHVSYQLRAVEW